MENDHPQPQEAVEKRARDVLDEHQYLYVDYNRIKLSISYLTTQM
jgi:hypothetical protein